MTTKASPIFIVGAPRSGTHLMRYCLSQHPKIYIAPETGYFLKIHGNRNNPFYSLRDKRSFGRLVSHRVLHGSGDPSMKEFVCFADDLAKRVEEAGPSEAALAEAVLSFFAEKKGKDWWGEKTPAHAFYLSEIRDVFPNALIIFMMRNPLNLVASFVASDLLPSSVFRAVSYLRLTQRALADEEEAVCRVSYEELTAHPEQVLQAVCAYLGTDFYGSMLRPGMRDSSYGAKSMEFDARIGIEATDTEKWKRILTSQQERDLRGLLGLGATRVPLLSRAKGAIDLARMRLSITKNRLGLEAILRPWSAWSGLD